MSAVHNDTPDATQPEIPVSDVRAAEPTPRGKSPAGAPPESQEPEVKSFFTQPKPKAQAPESQLPDVSKLSPEVQAIVKSFQSDYTKKTQATAEEKRQIDLERAAIKAEREAMQRNHDALLEAIKGRQAPEQGVEKPDPMAQVRALREDGRSDEADALLVKVAQDAMQAQLAPEKERQANESLKTTFQSTAMDVVTQNPLVAEYKADVVKVFDARSPLMDNLRADILGSPERIKTYVPMVLNAIATEIHAKRLEETFEARVEAAVKQRLESNKAKARSVPSSLLSTSQISREAPTRHGSLAAAIAVAAEKIAAGSN